MYARLCDFKLADQAGIMSFMVWWQAEADGNRTENFTLSKESVLACLNTVYDSAQHERERLYVERRTSGRDCVRVAAVIEI